MSGDMKLVGLMMVKNEDWILRASLNAALRWCDTVVIWDDGSLDDTRTIAAEAVANSLNCAYIENNHEGHWDEMHRRQEHLEVGRKLGGTHFAIIDADEILTYNNLEHVRGWFKQLKPRQVLDVPMIPMRTLDGWQDDGSVWSRAKLTLGFCDDVTLSHKPRADGYQHHNRPPFGCRAERVTPAIKSGGVMHLQFCNKRRLLAKHVLYRMVDYLRWPERDTINQINARYDQALWEPKTLANVPAEWWGDYYKDQIVLEDEPWQDYEIRRLLMKHGRDKFKGLDLKGY